jgi:hypothetical protein
MAGRAKSGQRRTRQPWHAPLPVLQVHVRLTGVEPQVWRRLHVPADADFWSLHVAINDAMGWLDCHLHQFQARHPATGEMAQIGIPDGEGVEAGVLAGWTVPAVEFLRQTGYLMLYEYDFGDGWVHEVTFESLLPMEPRASYPRCVGGERACPPEDCGGPHGYVMLLEALADSRHPQHKEMRGWAGKRFDPGRFDSARVSFRDPAAALARLLEHDL